MGKKKKKGSTVDATGDIKKEECTLFGSVNGWLKVVYSDGVESEFKPKEHTIRDEPVMWYKIGEFENV